MWPAEKCEMQNVNCEMCNVHVHVADSDSDSDSEVGGSACLQSACLDVDMAQPYHGRWLGGGGGALKLGMIQGRSRARLSDR